LTRLLDEPELVRAVQSLDARRLGQLVNHLGLEDSGEILSLATTDQIAQVFDEDLWRPAGLGQDESFDGDRFALWLEVMLEAGDDFTARRLTELDPDLVTLAFLKQVLVIDLDALAVEIAEGRDAGGLSEADLTEKALESCLSHEIGAYQVIARRPESWDAILTALVALDKDHHDLLERLLERCCQICAGTIEESGGLYQALTGGEMLESDVGGDREQRRERQGFVAPSAATSFLNLAVMTELAAILDAREADPITKGYFRTYETRPAARSGGAPPQPAEQPENDAAARSLARLNEALREVAAQAEEPAMTALPRLEAGEASGDADASADSHGTETAAARRFRAALRSISDHDAALAAKRLGELSYIANVVISGCRWADRRVRPAEATEIVVAVCGRGLDWLIERSGKADADALAQRLVTELDAVKLFRAGWKLLDEEHALPAGLRWDRR
jgi:hypothetical protein